MSAEAGRTSGSTSATCTAITRDGLPQLRRRWRVVRPRAAMLLVHGVGEHSGRYEHVGDFLSARGIDVLGFDHRGFGQSGGRRAHVERFEQYLDDVEDLLAERRRLSLPVILLGHSMGGLIATRYLVDGRPRPDLAVLSSPALAAELPAWQRMLAAVLGRIAPRVVIPSRIDPAVLSRDPAVVERYTNDPLVVDAASAGLGRALIDAMATTSIVLDRITTPTYVLHGGADTLVPPAASAELERLPNVTRRVHAGLRHECLNEPEWPAVLEDLMAWIDEQLARLD